ncbi:MAG: hypothetical protein K2P93_06495 [Alphaproteobacteria bacterium]|nr:hypothetical protein [Alphaproteobacteria bacterium]
MGRRRYAVCNFSLSFPDIERLSSEISALFYQIQNPHLQKFHFKIPHLYWKIGRLIAEYEQQQAIKEEDRSELLFQLIERFIKKFGSQFMQSMFEESRQFYFLYPSAFKTQRKLNASGDNSQLQAPLSWEHYRLLIYIDCPKARVFYEKEAFNSNWTPSLLQHFIKSRLFERLCTSVNKESVLRSAQLRSLELLSTNT